MINGGPTLRRKCKSGYPRNRIAFAAISLTRILTLVPLVLAIAIQFAAADPNKVSIPASTQPSLLNPSDQPISNISYSCPSGSAHKCNLDDFFRRIRVCGLMVLKDGKIVLAKYNEDRTYCPDEDNPQQPNRADRLYGLASVTKSIVSTLLGFFIADKSAAPDGALDLSVLSDPVDKYLPELSQSASAGGYSGLPIDLLLRMRAGLKYHEYGSWWQSSDTDRMASEVMDASKWTKTFSQFAAEIKPISGQRGEFDYVSLNAAILGLIIERALPPEQRLSDYLEAKLWQPLGMNYGASWKYDMNRTPAGYCCLKAAIPDLARFGQFVLEQGRDIQGKQLLAASWFAVATQHANVDDSIKPGNDSYNSVCPTEAPLDYRYQWWLFKAPRSDFTAIGINGQFIHIYPDHHLVIVQISDWDKWSAPSECESVAVHDAIAAVLGP